MVRTGSDTIAAGWGYAATALLTLASFASSPSLAKILKKVLVMVRKG